MTWADRGYLVIQTSRPSAEDAAVLDQARAALQAVGWRCAISVEGLEVHLGPRSPLNVRLVHRRHVLIGEYRWRDRALSAVIGGSRGPIDLGRGAVRAGWGQYILAWRTDDDRLGLLRDPSGAIDCLVWRRGGLRIAADQLPPEIDMLLPEAVAIDWPVLGEIADQPGVLRV